MIQADGSKRFVKFDYFTDKQNNLEIDNQKKVPLNQEDV
jgi:hypothetical protein